MAAFDYWRSCGGRPASDRRSAKRISLRRDRDGKWIKADEAAKTLSGETTYQVYGLTESLGEAKGGKPKPSEENVCSDVLTVSLSPETEKGVIAIAAPWNALPRKPRVTDTTQAVYVDAVRDFLKTKGIEQPKVKIDNILRVDLDGDGEDEVLISATNYFSKDNRVPMRSPAGSYSMVLLRCVVAGKVETQLIVGEFYPKAYPKAAQEEGRFNAPNAYKVIARSGSGWRRQNGSRRGFELLRRRSDNDLSLRGKEKG